jgi:hypothetical protein
MSQPRFWSKNLPKGKPMREVKSPNSLTRDQYHPQRGISPGSRSSPSNAARSDSGHLVRSPGKGGGPASVRCDAVPVQGGWRSPVDPRE